MVVERGNKALALSLPTSATTRDLDLESNKRDKKRENESLLLKK